MNETWLRIGILIIGLVVILLYYWFVVRAKNHHGEVPIKNPGLFSRKPSVPDFSDVESDDVKITRRIPAEEADKIRAQSAEASTAKSNQSSPSAEVDVSSHDNSAHESEASASSSTVPHSAAESTDQSSADQDVAPKAMETIDLFEQPSASAGAVPEAALTSGAPETADAIVTKAEPDSVADRTAVEPSAVTEGNEAAMTTPTDPAGDLDNDAAKTAMRTHNGHSGDDSNVDTNNSINSHEQSVSDESAEWVQDVESAHDAHATSDSVAKIDPEDAATTADETVTYEQSQSIPTPTPAPESVPIKDREYSRRRGGGLLGLLGLRRGSKAAEKISSSDTVSSEAGDDATQGKLSYIPPASHEAPKAPESLNRPVVISLYPKPDGRLFSGREIKKIMNTFSLVLSSKTGLYESLNPLSAPGEVETVFSVGHLRGEGRFSRTTINTMETSGLVFFMNIPGPVNAADAVDMMFGVASKSAKILDAKICDQDKRVLAVSQMINMRYEAVSYEQALIDRNLL